MDTFYCKVVPILLRLLSLILWQYIDCYKGLKKKKTKIKNMTLQKFFVWNKKSKISRGWWHESILQELNS